MNGRVYDPVLGRFMSADPFVQAPHNSQSYNRYSYVFNNPLSFTDPTGYATEATKWDFAIEEVEVIGRKRSLEDSFNQSNIQSMLSWQASQNHGEQWAYTNGAAYNVNSYWGVMLYSLAAGGYGANGNSNDALNQNLSSELNRLQGLIEWGNDPLGAHAWAHGYNNDEQMKTVSLTIASVFPIGTGVALSGRLLGFLKFTKSGRSYTQEFLKMKRLKGDTDIMPGSRTDAEILGKGWVNGKKVDRFELDHGGYGLTDGTRTFRIQYKPKDGMWKANFQENTFIQGRAKGIQIKNVHMNITDMVAP